MIEFKDNIVIIRFRKWKYVGKKKMISFTKTDYSKILNNKYYENSNNDDIINVR